MSRIVIFDRAFSICAYIGSPRCRSSADEGQAFVLGEVFEVLDVQGGERQVVDQAASGDPGVVLRSWPAALCGVGGDLAPGSGDLVGVGEGGARSQPSCEVSAPRSGPLAHGGPPDEFAKGDEGDAGLRADELA